MDRSFTKDEIKILGKLTAAGGTANVMEILEWPVSRFEEGFMLANEMQNSNLVKLLYSNFNKNLVVVELTLVGQNEYLQVMKTRREKPTS
ncbi:MAG: hypothetical protein HY015_10100 [Bacteroidetes bacterium]|nr:hypothetical protein [Bacteroidota bacterium]MBI3483302.1 hypothetical protein [Bacteroidota bacterium]